MIDRKSLEDMRRMLSVVLDNEEFLYNAYNSELNHTPYEKTAFNFIVENRRNLMVSKGILCKMIEGFDDNHLGGVEHQ